MGFFDDIVFSSGRLSNKNKWKCKKCGKVIESEFQPRQSIITLTEDPCRGAKRIGEWHDYRRV